MYKYDWKQVFNKGESIRTFKLNLYKENHINILRIEWKLPTHLTDQGKETKEQETIFKKK